MRKVSGEFMSDNLRFKVRKKYKQKFLKHSFLLFLYQIKYNILSFTAHIFFSNKKEGKTTVPLLFTNKILNKNICKCQMIFEKCEYYKEKIVKTEKIENTEGL